MRCEKPLTKTSKPYKLTTTPEARKDSHHTYHRDCSFFSNLLILDNFFTISIFLFLEETNIKKKPIMPFLLYRFLNKLKITKLNILIFANYANTQRSVFKII